MNKKIFLIFVFLFIITPLNVFGAEDILKIDRILIFQIIIFIAAIFILNSVLFKPFFQLLERREKLTIGTLKEAKELRERIDLIIGEYNARLDEARAQALEERNQIRREAQTTAEELLIKAKEETQAFLSNAIKKLASEKRENEEKIKPDIEALAKDVAIRILGKEL